MKSIVRELAGWLVYIIIIVVITWTVVTFLGQRTAVSGSSMEPTLSNGDQLIVDKLSYRFGEPSRFDVVVFPYKYKNNTFFIKRIIGMPGETIQIVDGAVYINGNRLPEDYGNEPMENAGIAAEPITLGADEYFLLGDNRNNSQDSRAANVGIVHRDELIGKAWVRIWPLNKAEVIRHE